MRTTDPKGVTRPPGQLGLFDVIAVEPEPEFSEFIAWADSHPVAVGTAVAA